jgi:hypothetical protein
MDQNMIALRLIIAADCPKAMARQRRQLDHLCRLGIASFPDSPCRQLRGGNQELNGDRCVI